MSLVLKREFMISESLWTVYYPHHLLDLGEVLTEAVLKYHLKTQESAIALVRILGIIEISGASYQIMTLPGLKEAYLGSLFFKDELFLKNILNPSSEIHPDEQKYLHQLDSLSLSSTNYPMAYQDITEKFHLEDLLKKNSYTPQTQSYLELKNKILNEVGSYQKSLFERASDLLLLWTAEYEVIRLYLLKILAILPCLDHDKKGSEVKIILKENLRRLNHSDHGLPIYLALTFKIVHILCYIIPQGLLASFIRGATKMLAKRFIAGVDIKDAATSIINLKKSQRDITIDQLGELVISEEEADQYLEKVLSIIAGLKNYYQKGERNVAGILRAHVSIKVSALCSQFSEHDFDFTYKQIAPRLFKIFNLAHQNHVFINIDAEHYHSRDMILQIYEKVLGECLDQSIRPETGIVLQAYLIDASTHLMDILKMSKNLDYKIIIRLVKGAYWDAETIHAKTHSYVPPQFLNKTETDLHFRQLGLEILINHKHLQLTIASHNILDHCWMRRVWEEHFSDTPQIEHQCLHMTYEALSMTLAKQGWAVRNYIPIGDLLVGMAYLVRRIMENSSQVGVLKMMRSHKSSHLLREPDAIYKENLNNGRHQTLKDFFPLNADFANVSPIRTYKRNHLELLHIEYQKAFDQAQQQAGPIYHTAEQIDEIIKLHNDALNEKTWFTDYTHRAQTLMRLSHLMLYHRAELSAHISEESHKSVLEALADVDEAIDFIQYYVRAAHDYGDLKAIGIITVIAPWNFPLAIPVGMGIGALVCGNAVIIKPAEQTPRIIRFFYELALKAGVPKYALSVVYGDKKQGSQLVSSPFVDGLVFTGSKQVGEMLYTQYGLTRKNRHGQIRSVIAEMGGKNPIIVTNNCELDETISGCLYSCYAHAGQKCSAASRIIVHKQVKDNFLARFIAASSNLNMSSAKDFSTYINPMISLEDKERILGDIQKLKAEVLRVGGIVHLDLNPQPGLTLGPVIVEIPQSAAKLNMAMINKEFFAPIVHITDYEKPEEALTLANNTEYALTAGIFGQSQDNLDYYSEHIEAGNIYVNRPNTGARVGIEPFGGYKMSGTGPKAGTHKYLRSFYRASQGFSALEFSGKSPIDDSEAAFTHKLGESLKLTPHETQQLKIMASQFFHFKQKKFLNTTIMDQKSYSLFHRNITSIDFFIDGKEPHFEFSAYLLLGHLSGAKITIYASEEHKNLYQKLPIKLDIKNLSPPQQWAEVVFTISEIFKDFDFSKTEFQDYLPKFYLLGEPIFKTKNPNELFEIFSKEQSYAINIMKHGAPLNESERVEHD